MSAERGAEISADGVYRYSLWRRWTDGEVMNFVMLNPSTADDENDDPTIRRCIGFDKRVEKLQRAGWEVKGGEVNSTLRSAS